MKLVGVAVLVAAEPHERLARGNGPDPTPEASVFAVLPDAAADFQESLLEHVFRVLRGPADPPTEVVHGYLERAIQRFEAGGVARLRLGQYGLRIGQQVRIHDKGFQHDPWKMPGVVGGSQMGHREQ